ncbi:T9SS type A sorting domain-containing protein [Chryseolinea soli]|uniref:T9SS C-terminal target domain-containing protein n=1 Tax=Chryseolinea soli TaxID=2321403 RepID=A0A385SQY2_9BACT|nr:T9SS type A sorting domain-containing protein [Chryseolinea soli]AYB33384.1 T9SS C-terminal target domain-containing protein [Chryseolinea soli]
MRGFYRITVIVLLCLPISLAAQGKLVLIGGGSESEGGWSDAPYRWVVDHAANKKVAVISYADEDNFIPDYFVSLGAAEATNIKIDSRTVADLQSTYDLLMTYDAFFFKGGDQSIYYTQFKNTKTMQAAIDKFHAGGVMSGTSAGMAILSGVMYTAENGSAYPDETLANLYNKNVTLANDFLAFLPGFLFDSHFTERGRIGRLLPFLAQWYLNKHELITGLGVDDRTALCIDPDRKAEVFGTGTVSIYNGSAYTAFKDEMPVADSIHAIQLLHGHRIDLTTFEILEGPTDVVSPQPSDETGNYAVALSGGGEVSENNDLLNFLVKENGQLHDTVVVVTAPGKGKTFIQKIKDLGGGATLVETAAASNDISQMALRNIIRRSKKILFVENDNGLLFNFLSAGPTGTLLNRHLRRNGMVVAFAGEDSRYAGHSFTTNHRTDGYAAYYGRLSYQKGLRLLPTSVIMANTFDPATTDYYENTTAAVSYAVVADSARYGIYLNKKNYVKFYQQNGRNHFKAMGDRSVLILMNRSTGAALASQPVNAGGPARDYAGFASMQYVLLNGNAVLDAGVPVPSTDAPYAFEYPVVGVDNEFGLSALQVFPNPSSSGIFNLSRDISASRNLELSIVDIVGRTLLEQHGGSLEQAVDLSGFPDGVYLLRIDNGKEISSMKVIKQR